MADSGRELYKTVNAADRLTSITVNGAASALDIAVNAGNPALPGRRRRRGRFGSQLR
jgi:hypothetical protein